MSMTLKIKITGDLPLPVNAVEMARLILAVEEKIDALRKLMGDNGGCMTGDGWTVQGRKRKVEQPPKMQPGFDVIMVPLDHPVPLIVTPAFGEILKKQGFDGYIVNKPLPIDDPLHIPAFLKGSAMGQGPPGEGRGGAS